MNKRTLAFIAAASLAATAIAQDQATRPALPVPAKQEVVAGEVARFRATVVSVDPATRVVVLKGQQGNTVSFVAGSEVRNLAQLHKGDLVTLEYAQALTVSLKKTGSAIRERAVKEVSSRAPKGQKPGGLLMRDVNVVATVQAIDAAKNTVTLRGPERTATLRVPDPGMLKGIKVGENVEVEYTEAAELKVEKGPAAPARK